MTHSPLFGLFSRALRLATESHRRGIPIDEYSEQHQSEKRQCLKRRSFLKKAGAFGGGILLAVGGQSCHAATLAEDIAAPKIAIVGAGIAGLNAAYTLKKAGYYATIYEASNRVGGRMYTIKDAVGEGVWVNLGAEYINSDHDDMLALAREFQIPLLDRFVAEELVLKDLYYFEGQTISEAKLAEALLPVAERMAVDIDRLDEDWDNVSVELDALSVADYCDRLGLSGWLRTFIETVMMTEMGLESDEITALNLIWLAPSADTESNVEATGVSDERYLVQNGTQAITDALARELQDRIETGMKLEAIRQDGDRFQLTFNYTDVEADIVVLAIPFSVLRSIPMQLSLPKTLRQFIDEVGYANNVKVTVGYNRPVWREQGLSGLGMTDLPLQTFFENSQLQPSPFGSLTYYLGGDIGFNSQRYSVSENARLYTEMLDPLIPNLLKTYNGKATRLHWPTYNYALGSYACFKPRQYTEFAQEYVYLEGEDEQNFNRGRLIFAGEHTSDAYQGYMNGGAQSGRLAAKTVLNQLKMGKS
ncbi:NAD(P)/FAD-dependent oxidoreductase [Roseofilum casamattae]|uniref:FAD-dependent oxidoreductase n=1 Tax=Roseofilum casamattae BLCC-M143 TaxID=3022442 RepID=A0ABT7C1E4_9CYAN|nr:FAD-dependent oxidoreductase [Roseofilum casamattae]MDJ1185120.1 FAD-dependent oxidoreductase [Roseofilum casamattae BLCC-M143]